MLLRNGSGSKRRRALAAWITLVLFGNAKQFVGSIVRESAGADGHG